MAGGSRLYRPGFHFELRVGTLFEEILAAHCLFAANISLSLSTRIIGRAPRRMPPILSGVCARALVCFGQPPNEAYIAKLNISPVCHQNLIDAVPKGTSDALKASRNGMWQLDAYPREVKMVTWTAKDAALAHSKRSQGASAMQLASKLASTMGPTRSPKQG